jgi:hypothetical protein
VREQCSRAVEVQPSGRKHGHKEMTKITQGRRERERISRSTELRSQQSVGDGALMAGGASRAEVAQLREHVRA